MNTNHKSKWPYTDTATMIEDLRGLIQIDSTSHKAGEITEEAPLGVRINDAINYVLGKAASFGFRTKNIRGYAGFAEIGDEDLKEMIALLVHVDTVPVGDGWKHNPFDLTVEDGKMYGRGTVDDKGPAMAALYAMKAIHDSGIELDRRVRLIVGGDEENGQWTCMSAYKETEELPTAAFSPDADYPVIFAEKGILGLKITADHPITDDLMIESGTVINIVPDYARAEKAGKTYEQKGTAAHAMEPHKGVNALLKLGKTLQEEGIEHEFLNLLRIANVKDLGIDFKDEPSGELTFNPAIAHLNQDEASLECDIRYPVTMDYQTIVDQVQKQVKPLGFDVSVSKQVDPLYVNKNSELVQKLLRVYEEFTGEKTEPISLGGGTYARAFDNAVAFGILFPGEENMCHQRDEYWSVKDFEDNVKILTEAIASLSRQS